MHPQQRESIFVLAVLSVVSVLFVVACRFFPVQGALSVFGLSGAIGLSPLIFHRKGSRKVLMDERDMKISAIAGSVSGGCVWVSTVTACMILLVRNGFGGDVCLPVISFSYAVVAATLIGFAARSIVILVLYQRGGQE